MPSPEHTQLKWCLLVHELFERIGVGCDNVTLVVKRLELLPESVLRALLVLLASGEVPGAFSLEDQIKMATRVRDEQLVEIDNRFAALHARIRSEAALQREHELAAVKQQEKEALSIHSATFYDEFEQRHEQALARRLAHLQLRYQQDCDDYTRKCEVDTESVTATIMSLMRPLGITSGKWQTIVGRIRKRLRVVFVVDLEQVPWVERHVAPLLRQCNVVSCPALTASDLHTVLYGHFHAEVQRLVRVDRVAVSIPEALREWEAFVAEMELVEHELPRLTKLAADIHLTALRHDRQRRQQQQESKQLDTTTWRALSLPSFFARFLESAYKKEREQLTRAKSFTSVYDSMRVELETLRHGDDELRARVLEGERQVAAYDAIIDEQTQSSARIRDMMSRFQDAADQQVAVTNAMEKQAQVELHVPLASLDEANAALLLIEKRHIVEIKSFNSPPLLVHLVLDAVCVLFGAEPTWENARKVLGDANVVQSMLSFDKDNVSDETLARLASPYMSDARFNRDDVEKQSLAASMMVVWVRAIYQYASTRRVVKPTLDKLEKAQGRLRLLMQEFHVSKQRAADADDELALSRASLARALEEKNKTVAEIESRKTRLATGLLALEALAEEKQHMETLLAHASRARERGLLGWNALLTTAFVVYGGGRCSADRAQLFVEWEAAYWRTVESTDAQGSDTHCRRLPALHMALRAQAAVEASSDGPCDDNVGSEDDGELDGVVELLCRTEPDRIDWQLVSGGGACFSIRRLQDALFLTEVNAAGFPVVLITDYGRDVEDLVLTCARNVWCWSDFFMVSAKVPEVDDVLVSAMRTGQQLLVLDVEPVDGEAGSGCLALAFQWTTCMVDGQEHLIISPPHSSTESSASSVGRSELVPIHPAFRVVLASHCAFCDFGETIARIPMLSGAIAPSEIATAILDKMWNLGVTLSETEPRRLKLAMREFAALTTRVREQQSQLTKLVQDAAANGDFQVAETTVLLETANAFQEIRTAIASKRKEIVQEVRRASELATLSAFGAAILNSFNATRVVRSVAQAPEATPPPQLSLQLFLPMFFSALSVQTARASTLEANSTGASSLEPQTQAGRRASLSHPATTFPAEASDERHKSERFNSLDSSSSSLESRIAAALQQMLTVLMPMVQSRSEWYAFLLRLLWTLESNRLRPPRATEADPREPDAIPSEVRVPSSYSVASVVMKLRRWNVPCSPQDATDAMAKLGALNAARILDLIVEGSALEGGASGGEALPPLVQRMFTVLRPRSERMKIGLALFPSLAEQVCDRILSAYGVSHRFARENDVVVPLGPYTKSTGSSSTALDSVEGSTASAFTTKRVDSSRNPVSGKHGWLRQVTAYPEDAGVLVMSTHRLQSFAFVQRTFFQTVFTKEVGVAILQQLVARSFQSASELDSVFVMPKRVLLNHASQHQARLVSGTDLHTKPLLLIRAFEDIRRLEREKPDVLEAAPLALVDMQRDKNPVHWEGLFQILHRSPQYTTSVTLRRQADTTEQSCLLKPVMVSPSTLSARAQGVDYVGDTTAAPRDLSSNGSSHSTSNAALSGRAPLMARRLSATQSVLHRHSDMSLVAPAYPRLVAVVKTWDGLPVHLHQNLLCLYDKADNCQHSLKKCVQATLLRLAFHPCRKQLHAALVSDSVDRKSKGKGTDDATGVDKDTASGASEQPHAPATLQVLSSLVLFHAVVMYRSEWMPELLRACSSRAPWTSVGYDQFVSAVNQLLHSPASLKPIKTLSGAVLFERLQQQVVLSAYTCTAPSQREVEVLTRLHRECFSLVDSGWLHAVTKLSNAPTPTTSVDSSARELAASFGSSRPTAPLVRRQSSNLRNLSRRFSLAFAAGGAGDAVLPPGLSSRALPASALAFIGFPREAFLSTQSTASIADLDPWFDVWWDFADSLDARHDAKLCQLFTGTSRLPHGDAHRHQVSPVGNVDHWIPTAVDTSVTELFGWTKTPVHCDRDLAASIPLAEAAQLIDVLLRPGSLPVRFDHAVSIVGGAEADNDEGETLAQPPAQLTPGNRETSRSPETLVGRLQSTFQAAFNSEVEDVRAFLTELRLAIARYNDAASTSLDQPSLHLLPDSETQRALLELLQAQVPTQLRASCGRGRLSLACFQRLPDLLAYYEAWGRFVAASAASAGPVWFWAPALDRVASVEQALQAARRDYCEQRVLDLDAFETRYSLRLQSSDRIGPDTVDEVGGTVFAVIIGVCVVGAAWSSARECLEPPVDMTTGQPEPIRSAPNRHDRAIIMCVLHPLGPRVSTSRPINDALRGSGSEPRRTIACPLLRLRDSTPLFAFELPAAPSLLDSLLTPLLLAEGTPSF